MDIQNRRNAAGRPNACRITQIILQAVCSRYSRGGRHYDSDGGGGGGGGADRRGGISSRCVPYYRRLLTAAADVVMMMRAACRIRGAASAVGQSIERHAGAELTWRGV